MAMDLSSNEVVAASSKKLLLSLSFRVDEWNCAESMMISSRAYLALDQMSEWNCFIDDLVCDTGGARRGRRRVARTVTRRASTNM